MGHQTLAMTVRYAHLSPGHRLDAVQRLVRPASGEATGTTTGTDAGDKQVAAGATGEVVDLPVESNEPCWDRTSDPLLKRQMLYRLS